jgi:hypothetical protein
MCVFMYVCIGASVWAAYMQTRLGDQVVCYRHEFLDLCVCMHACMYVCMYLCVLNYYRLGDQMVYYGHESLYACMHV